MLLPMASHHVLLHTSQTNWQLRICFWTATFTWIICKRQPISQQNKTGNAHVT